MVRPMSLKNCLRGTVGALALALMVAAPTPPVFADSIYRFVDKDGVIHFSNVPTDSRYRKVFDDRIPDRIKSTGRPKGVTPQTFSRSIAQTAGLHQLDPALVRAVIQTESAFDPRAESPKGAMGLMQLMPATALSLNVTNPYDPDQNISGGVRHLRYLIDRFGGDVRLALAAYNAGENRVLRDKRIPAITETREYVKRVMFFYKQFSRETEPALVSRRFVNYLSPN
jgi:hypothetical protein